MSMEREYPTILERIKSTTIDTIIIIAFMYFASEILNSFENVPDFIRMILFALILLYEPILTAFGATIGNEKMEIRVRSNANHAKKINFFQAVIRVILKYLLGWLSFITLFFSDKGRTIHDYASGSIMIKV
ncbi:RDD family protein [Flavobacterium piscinae]|uniref:RDD family protein n=2 Tax=Flavobacterium piscinae TaxID=2506424 RepID=A0A4V1N480_9FLAO|nr:RDD family protein [Flavobacterium piscinae]